MASGALFVVVLATVMFCAVSNCGVFAGEEDCPSVDDMFCLWKQPVGEDCRQETYITLDDGTKCPACELCLNSKRISVGQTLGLSCPIAACPSLQLPQNCTEAKFYTLNMDLNGETCSQCETYVCQ